MSIKYINTILIVVLSFGMANSQQMPLDFSDASDDFTPFGNSGFSRRISPSDGSDMVGEFYNDGSDPWQGFTIDLAQAINLGSQNSITLDFYAFDPNNHTIMVKLENGTNPDVQVEMNNSGSGWENGIAFDFSNAVLSSDGTTPVNATGTYDRLTIFIDGGSTISGTYLIDDINDGSTPTDPHALDVIYNDLVWFDEFDSTIPETIDAAKWHHQTFGPNGGRWFNNEEQHYTDRLDNSYVENGFLNIVAKKENFSQDGVTLLYTSARLNSKFAFTYGRVDVRAKLPAGEGTWPAIWTLGKNINETGAYWQTQGFGTTPWPACGEIDIMEHGLHATNETSSAIHTPSSSGNTVNTDKQLLNDVANNFHVYSVNWSPNQITFLVDGVGFYTYNPAVKDASTWPFDLEQYLILNVAMGGVSGAIDTGFTQSPMVIDYVRVYQNTALSTDENSIGKLSVYPNPVRDTLFINSEIHIESVKVFDGFGKLIFEKKPIKEALDISGLKAGLYFLQLYSAKGDVIKRIIKE